jgi:3-hydroxybutyryl-CoA dehydrogenase
MSIPNFDTVAVIGAGPRGAGIAQVAAQAGHRVRLYDARDGAARDARDKLKSTLEGLVAKGKLDAAAADAAIARIEPAASLAQLADARLVVEAIVENLAVKQGLLRELEALVAPDAVLASNTSSLSITALARDMKHPGRLVGMHFFNPVPLMKLVEVVSGLRTERVVADAIFELALAWGKTPVHAQSTPGFIVNRIARPYYAEALALLQERAATPPQLDATLRGAGFRMGPCELMDLIGHDVNYAVTQSVFEANYFDRRYVPSLVQKALLDGGRLGRKAGKGFYDGVPAANASSTSETPPLPAPLTLCGEGPVARLLEGWLTRRGLAFARVPVSAWSGLKIGDIEMRVTDGCTAMQLAAETHRPELAVIDLPLVGDKSAAIGVAFAASASADTRQMVSMTLQACGWQVKELRDVPGLWVARTVCMLINEAADAVHQGVCDEAAADLAMKLGTNWPAGPFEWLEQIGVEAVVAVLDHLHAATRNERYRVSPLLQQRLWAWRLRTRV